VPLEVFTRELRKWGVRHLLVWSGASTSYLRGHDSHFGERWSRGRWRQFEYLGADARSAVSSQGSAAIAAFDPLGARIELQNVEAGARIVVRTNYHPVWTAVLDSTREQLPLENVEGQLAFVAPRAGSYAVLLAYPRRTWIALATAAALLLGSALSLRWTAAAHPKRRFDA
jgi:hypothetical protein